MSFIFPFHLYSVAGPLMSNFSDHCKNSHRSLNGAVLIVLHPLTQLIKLIWVIQPQDCLEDVLKLLLKFLLGFGVGFLLGFTHWCLGNVGRGAHVEVVKGGLYNYVRVRVTERLKFKILDEFLGHVVMLVTREMFN